MIQVSDYIVKYLEDIGVRYVFSVVGGGAMFLNNSFGKSKEQRADQSRSGPGARFLEDRR